MRPPAPVPAPGPALALNPDRPSPPRVTVATATFNRAHLLRRPFASLAAQGGVGFEWLVIDDGSTDATAAAVRALAQEAAFPVRYLRQPNGGYITAIRSAFAAARAPITVLLDSDDALLPGALAAGLRRWDEEGLDARADLLGLYFARVTERGEPATRNLRAERVECSATDIRFRHRVRGDFLVFRKTAAVRGCPFPRPFLKGGQIPPSVVWHRLARDYKGIYLREPLAVLYRHDGEHRNTSHAPSRRRLHYCYFMAVGELSNAIGYIGTDPRRWWRAAGRAAMLGTALDRPLGEQWRDVATFGGRLLWSAHLPAALLRRQRRRRRPPGPA